MSEDASLSPLPPESSLWERIPLLVQRPSVAFARVAQRPAWWLPGLVLFVLVALYTAMNCHVIVPGSLSAALDKADGKQLEVLQKQMALFSDPPAWLRFITGFGAGFGIWVVMAIQALIYHLFLRLSEGKGTVGQSFGVVYWAALVPTLMKTLLSWIVIVVTDGAHLLRDTGLAALVPDKASDSLPYQLATFFGDVFSIWTVVLTIIGFAVVHRIARGRSALVTVLVYVLISACMIGLSLLGKAMGRG